MSYHRFIGADPGKKGGLSVLNAGGTLLASRPMPLDADENVDSDAVWVWASEWTDGGELSTFLTVEKTWARPGQGVVSMHTFGLQAGYLTAALEVSLHRKAHLVAPLTWMRSLMGNVGAEDSKSLAREFAQKTWPAHSFLATKRSRKPHEGMVDAALIALYGLRNHQALES